ncbi:ABC transporter substrate-binding protein [Mesorhizobium sp. M8A.F.Ca.ET.165.01.1.1]|uniref:ABC transporter substrate-binding protein n=1 Tax=Mesorhizobium sp. M8A.F.Ca.ET.165.01.1.1 TaxID=2563960 RepID=UPI001093FAC2|nr:ABC transporter substrate-binding protein [Mesorhizobium sp. M8A.F.Ca.ET.165.01.1.1]TGT46330.1 ABC transporter substrate-binding protein [Mesorhizobium sp. M8A.F.Ca.ET.165.01.1.1]
MISRRTFLATTAAAAMAGTLKSHAGSFEGQTLRVQFWGGSDGLAIQKYVADPFMKATGAKVVVEEGVTSASIAKVTAQKSDPQIDVAFLDDVGVFALNRQGLLDKIDLEKVPNAKDVYPNFILDGGFGIGFWTYITTILNNTKSPAPTSWEDLWSPAYQGKVLVPSINDTQALLLTVMAAQLGGGSLENLAPAWPKLAALKPQVFSFIENRALDAQALQAGQATAAVDIPTYFKPYMADSSDIGVATDLKEGYFAITGAAVLVKGSRGNRDLAHAFINQALSPEAQAGFATDVWYGPTNQKTIVSESAAPYVVHTPEQLAKAIQVPRLDLVSKRPEIVQNWNKIFNS